MGTANADPVVDIYAHDPALIAIGDVNTPNDAYDILVRVCRHPGRPKRPPGLSTAQSNLASYESFTTDVDAFEQTAGDHGLENLIYAIDPSAFYEQTTPGVLGTITDTAGAYLVPESVLGYLATGLDFGLLTPTGLDFVLTPLIDILLGQPFGCVWPQ